MITVFSQTLKLAFFMLYEPQPKALTGALSRRKHQMNRKQSILIDAGLLTVAAMTSRADEIEASTNAAPVALYHPFTIDAEAGTTGAGGGANVRFLDHFGASGAFDYFRYFYSTTIGGINFNSRLRLMSEPATLDLYPWKNHSFHLSVGALFNQNQLSGGKTGTVDLDGSPFSGTVGMSVKQQPVDPYVAVGGNLYFDKRHHFSLGTEVGLFYTGEPRISLSAPGAPPSAVIGEENKIRHYARVAEFWPVFKLSLNYSF